MYAIRSYYDCHLLISPDSLNKIIAKAFALHGDVYSANKWYQKVLDGEQPDSHRQRVSILLQWATAIEKISDLHDLSKLFDMA